MLSAAALGAAFGVLDKLVADYALKTLYSIRFGLMVPAIFFGFLLSFVPYFRQRYHLVVIATVVVVGGSIIAMIATIVPPAADYYYAGLIMVLLFSYTFLQLRLTHATISAAILFIGYEIVAIISQSSPREAVINNTFFLFAANYGGIFACYTIERVRRDNFLQFRALQIEKMKTESVAVQLERISTRDELTNLFNRRQLERVTSDILNENEGSSSPTALLLIDLDNFKRVNDGDGHIAGDRVLMNVGRILSEGVGDAGLVFRFGGDEFVVILQGENALSGIGVARRIMDGFRVWAQQSDSAKSALLGLSIGITEVVPSKDSLSSLMERADKALYRAKRLGKGRIVAIPSQRFDSEDESLDELDRREPDP
jgi:diguanylate cyclase (GGDEF)-like protein